MRLPLVIGMMLLFRFSAAADDFLVSYTLVKSDSKKSISALWKQHKIPKLVLPVKNDVDVYEIIYKAKWIDSTWINCSGIYYVPKIKKAAPYMMFGHGTQIQKQREISNSNPEQIICLGFAADGYISCFPDYYGIGKGDGRHLYQHAWSEAMSFIYMLYAVEELNVKLKIKNNGQLFLTGYSQGGHASFAAQKYLEALNDKRFIVTASSPMSGAYDMTGEQEKYMFQKYPKPFYLPYLLTSYQAAYNILPDTKNIYSIFKPPFDTLLPNFFEKNLANSFDKLDKLLPSVPMEMLTESFIEQYKTDTNFIFKNKLIENNLTNWKPLAPVQFCYCKGDREVNYRNSEVAYNTMKLNGVTKIKLNNISNNLDHNTCAAFAVMSTKFYFDRFKNKGNNPNMKDTPKFIKSISKLVMKKEEKKYLTSKQDNPRF